ncbi:GTPase activating protein [Tulasnella sp. 427]|nr:GTPase activating protein [Tulasnella sp. 427]
MGGGPAADHSNYDDISTRSEDSMVEIVQSTPEQAELAARYVLVYSKSKVYVHPTAFSRDNIPGFVAIVKKDTLLPTYLLSWIPESLLDQKGDGEWEKYYRVEAGASIADDDDAILIDPLPQRGESYAFSVPLTSIYSFMVTAPTFSSWYGSLTINMTNGSTLATLHFHDDESPSMQFSRSSPNAPTWGGEVDPSKADIEAHTTILYEDLDFETSSSPVPVHLRPKTTRRSSGGSNGRSRPPSMLHDSLSSPVNAKMALLSGFSQLTRATRHAAQSVLSHPLAKPIIPHLPDPVRSLVNVQGEWTGWVEQGGVGEYESARVYLAKWARIVAEEGERSRQREAHTLPGTTGDEETSDLGVFELLAESSNLQTPKPTRDPRHPIDKVTWESWFDPSGKPTLEWLDFKKEVFRRGLAIDTKRKAWPFLLGVVPWSSNTAERDALWEDKRKTYETLKAQWKGVDEVFNSPEMIEERHRIDVDCRRTDRTHPLFSLAETSSGSSIAVSEDVGAHTQANKHVDTLSVILLTYHMFEKELGYVQGMSDLLSPLYVVCGGDEVESFWCFVAFMQRMKSNFLRDQSGMRRQLSTLQNLLSVMDPELYRHFEKAGALNLFFCYRWILILFKREFPFEDVVNFWECIWTDYYSTQFHLFVALAVLESHRDVILRYLVEFDEVLKYCNDLSMTIELDSTLAQAEVLFLSFFQIVSDIDRRRAETTNTVQIRRRKKTSGAGTGSSSADELQTVSLPIVDDDLRELLISGK